jgi:translation initiation factor 2B subunit (eIF-2B alpha/beta/delta family)
VSVRSVEYVAPSAAEICLLLHCCSCRRRHLTGALEVALATIDLIRTIVASTLWKSVDDLLDRVKEVGQKLVAANRAELTIGNMVRRCIFIIRDECRSVSRAAVSPMAATSQAKAVELTSPLKLGNSVAGANRIRMKRSMSMSLLYDADDDDNAQASAFDEAFASVDASRRESASGLDALDSELRASLLGSIDEFVDEINVRIVCATRAVERSSTGLDQAHQRAGARAHTRRRGHTDVRQVSDSRELPRLRGAQEALQSVRRRDSTWCVYAAAPRSRTRCSHRS